MRLRRLPILLVYLLVLTGSPVGRAAALWVHLRAAHGSASGPLVQVAVQPAPAPSTEPRPAEPPPGPREDHRHADAVTAHAHPHPHPKQGRHPHPHADHAPAAPVRHAAHPDQAPPPTPFAGAAIGQPHEHDGVVHTHADPQDEGDPRVPQISERYLAPTPAPDPVGRILTIPAPAGTDRAIGAVAAIETPPPRVG